MTALVIVESPAKAKTINKYLGKDYKVIASFGHIRNLPSKDGSVKPEEDFAMIYEISSKSKKHIKEIEQLAKNSEAIYLACDPDREGEAIAWHVVQVLKENKKIKENTIVKRVVFNEITKSAVVNALKNPRDIDMDLVNAQQARTALDYLVGFNLSPILWRKLPGSKSAGRVQSVALRLICERESEIEKFITQEYWSIKVDLANQTSEQFTSVLTHLNDKKLEKFSINNQKQAEEIAKNLEIKNYQVSSIEKKQTKRHPQPPFTTSSLQQEAHRKLGFTAKKTMMIAQKLYEGIEIDGEQIGLITYMRTDAVTMANDAILNARKFIEHSFGQEYLPSKERVYKSKAKNAQEAHEAIRPTDFFKTFEKMGKYLEKDEFKLYELIWKRAIASQMESAVFDVVTAIIKTKDDYAMLRASGSVIVFPGFYKLYRESNDDNNEDENDNRLLPPLKENELLALIGVNPNQHFTDPPPRYTEASLVKKMEELGIGRPSTYATIISVIQERNYVKLDKKRFVPEDRGRIVTAFLESYFKKYVEYDFTAQLEDKLDDISVGNIGWRDLLKEFWHDFKPSTQEVLKFPNSEIMEAINKDLEYHFFVKDGTNEVDRKCPECSNGILSIKASKFGAFIGCSNYPECRYTRKLTDDLNEENAIENEDRLIGYDDGLEINLKKGPYGFYLQKGQTKEDIKRVSVPKNIDLDSLSLDDAKLLLSLPRKLGIDENSGKEIKLGIGKFGPYLQIGTAYVSVKDDIRTVDYEKASELIKNSGKAGKAAEGKILGKHPEDNKDVSLLVGRYGPYIKHNKLNAPIPKSVNAESVTLEMALEYLQKQKDKKAK